MQAQVQRRDFERKRLVSSNEQRKLTATMSEMFHHRDIVEEITTQRQGEIDAVDQFISGGKEQSPRRWRVRFLDDREPRFQYFVNPADLRLIQCPHAGQ